jgi:argininosuccinate lyase
MTSIARTAATGGALHPDFLRWSTSLPVDRRLLAVDCEGSIAHVRGLEHAGLLDASEAVRLVDALRSLPGRVDSGEVVLAPDEEDVHMAIEAWLRSEVGDVVGKLHTGRSRNDQVATDLALWMRSAVARIEAAIDAVQEAATSWQARNGDVAMPTYTHRQVAIPALGRVWLAGALTEGLRRDRALLEAVRAELRTCPLGAGAIGGTTLPIDTSVAATALGFEAGPTNPLDAVGSRDHALLLLFACARIGMHLGRLCTDVIELSSDGLVVLGGAIAGGSSMMPHKRNPDLFELVRGQAAMRHGELVQLMVTFQALGSGYLRDLQQDKQIVFSSVDGVCDCLKMITIALDHFDLVPDACRAALERGDAIATDLCEALVADGMAFRDAYAVVGKLVVTQRERGKRLVDLDAAALEAAGLSGALAAKLDVGESARVRASRFRP